MIRQRFLVPVVLGLLHALVLAGCDGAASNPAPSAAPPGSATTVVSPPQPIPDGLHIPGRFVGTVTSNGVQYFGDAIITIDGAIRLYVGGPYSSTGVIQISKPAASAQLVGTVAMSNDSASGSGSVIGQGCADPQANRFCTRMSTAQISLTASARELRGEIRVSAQGSDEVWELDLVSWDNWYRFPARQGDLEGRYSELLAEFAPETEVTVSVDSLGVLRFDNPQSGCSGRGKFTPHRDGAVNVFDVSMDMQGCSGSYAYLNGQYEGLGTTSTSDYWAYDSNLRVWLMKPGVGTSQAAALTMWALVL